MTKPQKRGTIIVMTSGKGGVGKTTSSASIGIALAKLGDSVILIDFDIGLRKLDLVLGVERAITHDIVDVIEHRANVEDAIVQTTTHPNLKLMPASQTSNKDALVKERVSEIVKALADHFTWVICDSPAGIESGAQMAMAEADIALIVVNPEISSIRDSDRMIGLIEQHATPSKPIDIHLLITRYSRRRARKNAMLDTDAIQQVLAIPIIGVIPESELVLTASNLGVPVTVSHPQCEAAINYTHTARRLRGETIPLYRPNWIKRWMHK